MTTPGKQAIVPEALLRPQEITRESLVALIEVAEKLNMEIPWWEKYGQPAFDRLVAVFEGPVESAGSVVQQVLGVQGMAAQVRVFPRGIPAVTSVRVEIEASGTGH
jgi:hypothetical protein